MGGSLSPVGRLAGGTEGRWNGSLDSRIAVAGVTKFLQEPCASLLHASLLLVFYRLPMPGQRSPLASVLKRVQTLSP